MRPRHGGAESVHPVHGAIESVCQGHGAPSYTMVRAGMSPCAGRTDATATCLGRTDPATCRPHGGSGPLVHEFSVIFAIDTKKARITGSRTKNAILLC